MEEQNSANPTTVPSTGLQPNVEAALSYVLGFVTGIIFFMISKDKFVRFHAAQSIALSVAVIVLNLVLGLIPFLGWIAAPLLSIGSLVLFIVLILKAYKGEKYKLPVLGDYAEKYI